MRVLAAIARRIIREETFDSLVAPALADLHFEAGARRPLARHYTALPVVIATALLRDLRIDFRLTFSAGRVWKRAAAWYAGFIALNAGLALYYNLPWHLLDVSGRAASLSTALGGGIIGAFPFAMAAVAFDLRRASTVPHRTITIAALCFAVIAIAFQAAAASVRPAVNQAILDSASRVIAEGRPGAGLEDENPYPGHWNNWLDAVRERSSDSRIFRGDVETAAASRTPAFALFVIPYALFGVVLARGRGWGVLFRALPLIATYVVAQLTALSLGVRLFHGLSANGEAVRELCASFIVALVWLLAARIAPAPDIGSPCPTGKEVPCRE